MTRRRPETQRLIRGGRLNYEAVPVLSGRFKGEGASVMQSVVNP